MATLGDSSWSEKTEITGPIDIKGQLAQNGIKATRMILMIMNKRKTGLKLRRKVRKIQSSRLEGCSINSGGILKKREREGDNCLEVALEPTSTNPYSCPGNSRCKRMGWDSKGRDRSISSLGSFSEF